MVTRRNSTIKADNKVSNVKTLNKKQNKTKRIPEKSKNGVRGENLNENGGVVNMYPKSDTAFMVILSVRFCSAIYSHITDCDETFNYWEPLHYLLYGRGLQTWEYSPEFALRSYTYLLMHGVPGWIYERLLQPNPIFVFYFIRCVLAVVSASTELYMYKATCREFGVHIGRMWIIFQLFCPGMFIASTALLPSSFSMYFSMAAWAAWWNQKYKLAIFITAISALLGWPFAVILSLPIGYDILIIQRKLRTFIFWAIISGITILIPMVVIDSSYFGKLVIAPLNLVLYNVFTSHGPNLYGTEPPSYYLINGFLNFNFIWLFALITPIMLILCWLFVPAKSRPTLFLPHYLSLSPLYLWLAVFMMQPHKEERFLFPIYPMITLCGAVSVDVAQKLFYRIKKVIKKLSNGHHYLDHTTFIAATVVVLSTIPSLARIISLYQNYNAPLHLMMELPQTTEFSKEKQFNVCFGKDWYRFPNSFFLPSENFRVRFIRSEFKGILPAYFDETANGTQIVQPYFNDLNQENDFMYFDPSKCSFLADLDAGRYTELELNYSQLTNDWNLIKSLPFLNADESHPLFRAFYIPYLSDKHVKMANFNLYQRRSRKGASPN